MSESWIQHSQTISPWQLNQMGNFHKENLTLKRKNIGHRKSASSTTATNRTGISQSRKAKKIHFKKIVNVLHNPLKSQLKETQVSKFQQKRQKLAQIKNIKSHKKLKPSVKLTPYPIYFHQTQKTQYSTTKQNNCARQSGTQAQYSRFANTFRNPKFIQAAVQFKKNNKFLSITQKQLQPKGRQKENYQFIDSRHQCFRKRNCKINSHNNSYNNSNNSSHNNYNFSQSHIKQSQSNIGPYQKEHRKQHKVHSNDYQFNDQQLFMQGKQISQKKHQAKQRSLNTSSYPHLRQDKAQSTQTIMKQIPNKTFSLQDIDKNKSHVKWLCLKENFKSANYGHVKNAIENKKMFAKNIQSRYRSSILSAVQTQDQKNVKKINCLLFNQIKKYNIFAQPAKSIRNSA